MLGEVGHVDVGSNLNPWVILQSLVKTPVDCVIEGGREKSKSLSNARRISKVIESLQLSLTFTLINE